MYGRAILAILVGALGVGVLGIRAAHAQEPGGDLATANALFDEARRLSAEGQFAEACAKFEASMTLAPRLGVQLNLADCYERVGRTASAWIAFGEAAALARRGTDQREVFARQRQDALVRRLSRLGVALAGAPVHGLTVRRDGRRMEPSSLGVDVPVDPGVHVVEVTAPGYLPWSTRVVVSGEGEVVRVMVPAPERSPPAPSPASPSPPPASLTRATAEPPERRFTRATWTAAGVGVAGIGAGTALGLRARSQWQQARRDCDGSNNCSDAADALIERSRRDGNIATLGFAIGGAALITGVVLYVRSPRSRGRPVQLAPLIAPATTGAAAAWAF